MLLCGNTIDNSFVVPFRRYYANGKITNDSNAMVVVVELNWLFRIVLPYQIEDLQMFTKKRERERKRERVVRKFT